MTVLRLDWKNTPVTLKTHSHPTLETTLSLELTSDLARALGDALQSLLKNPNASELQLLLTQGWVLYWKIRTTTTRVTLAHPQESEWVASVHLHPDHAQRLIERLHQMVGSDSKEMLGLSKLGSVAALSNLEVVFIKA
ncbi:MAG: hypothetical protein AB1540_04660 [Bdellovibrionota bacterium]